MGCFLMIEIAIPLISLRNILVQVSHSKQYPIFMLCMERLKRMIVSKIYLCRILSSILCNDQMDVITFILPNFYHEIVFIHGFQIDFHEVL